MTGAPHPADAGPAWLLAGLDAWDGRLPVALWGEVDGLAARRALLRRLAAHALEDDAVAIVHDQDMPPRLVAPAGAGLTLSSASRDGVAVAAVGAGPVGIDVERVDAAADPPWNVLHPDEARALRALAGHARAEAFAAIWAAKEAYLKARGTGFARDPREAPVALVDGLARIHADGVPVRVDLSWLTLRQGRFVIALVSLAAD